MLTFFFFLCCILYKHFIQKLNGGNAAAKVQLDVSTAHLKERKRGRTVVSCLHMHLLNKETLTWHDREKLCHLSEIKSDQIPLVLHATNSLHTHGGVTEPAVFLLIQ